MSASAHALHLPSMVVQLFEAQKKIGKIQSKLFPKGGIVRKGFTKDLGSYEPIEEVESFRKRQEVPGKCFWMSEVSGGLEKCMEAW